MTDPKKSYFWTEPGGLVRIEAFERITNGMVYNEGVYNVKHEIDDPEKAVYKTWGKGVQATWFCDIVDANGEFVGNTIGTMTILGEDWRTGHWREHIAEQFIFRDGAITCWGTQDRTDVIAQKWITYRAEGTSGIFFGMNGTRSYQITSLEDDGYPAHGKWELR